jgi:hypothetical protein
MATKVGTKQPLCQLRQRSRPGCCMSGAMSGRLSGRARWSARWSERIYELFDIAAGYCSPGRSPRNYLMGESKSVSAFDADVDVCRAAPIRVVSNRSHRKARPSSTEEDSLFAFGYLNFWGPGPRSTGLMIQLAIQLSIIYATTGTFGSSFGKGV